MQYHSVIVSDNHTEEYSLYLTHNYIMPTVDYTVYRVGNNTVEYRFKQVAHYAQFIRRWGL